MDNLALLLVYSLPLIPIFYFKKNSRKKYFALGLFTLLIAILFEIFSVSFGFWSYQAKPTIFSVAVFTWLAYFPWLIYVYFSGNYLKKVIQK